MLGRNDDAKSSIVISASTSLTFVDNDGRLRAYGLLRVGKLCSSFPTKEMSSEFVAILRWAIGFNMLASFRSPFTLIQAFKINRILLVNDVIWWRSMTSLSCDSQAIIFPEKVGANLEMKRSNILISNLCKEGRIDEARRLFDEMAEWDVVLWTTMITGYIKCGMMKEARRLFDRVDAKNNVVTWTAMVAGYIRFNQIKEAERLFYSMPLRNVVSWNTMIDGYARNDQIESALDLFRRMPERNIVSWNTIITALSQSGRIEDACGLFNQMPNRDVISWTAMVVGLSKNGKIDEARALFDNMPVRNVVSWNAMIAGYAQNKRFDEAIELFKRMPERDTPSWNTMITGFIRNGNLEKAEKLFNEMPHKNVITWTAMMTGYVQHGRSEEALKMFNKMLTIDGIKPNTGTFVTVLGACSDLAGICEGQQIHQLGFDILEWDDCWICTSWLCHSGLVKEGLKFFDDLFKNKSIQVNEDHYTCLIDLCGRAGRLKEAFNIIEGLGEKASLSIWGALLAGCNVHGNADIVGKWKEAAIMRMKMKDKGLKKQPGCSWIEVKNKVQVFVVSDKSHSQSEEIDYLLVDLHAKMMKIGDIPDDDLLVHVEI
ncbi:hypothetical protein K1719_026636 [Acacia pycnantha]|nr:hypothetical protein K1719_026636 [Acacia pycnantha]